MGRNLISLTFVHNYGGGDFKRSQSVQFTAIVPCALNILGPVFFCRPSSSVRSFLWCLWYWGTCTANPSLIGLFRHTAAGCREHLDYTTGTATALGSSQTFRMILHPEEHPPFLENSAHHPALSLFSLGSRCSGSTLWLRYLCLSPKRRLLLRELLMLNTW